MFKIAHHDGHLSLNYKNKFVKAGTREDLKMFIEHTNSKPEEFKGKFHCLHGCTECCQQQVQVSEREIAKIRRALRNLDTDYIQKLKHQERGETTCPLLDIETGKCSVYNARPEICSEFGCHTGSMACSYNLDVELGDVHKYFADLVNNPRHNQHLAGKLGVDFTWEKGLIKS